MDNTQHKDRPRDEIIKMAQQVIDRAAGRAKVYFKFTCPACGERLTLEEPNTLFEEGECSKCGETHPIEKAGYIILLSMPVKVENQTKVYEFEVSEELKDGKPTA